MTDEMTQIVCGLMAVASMFVAAFTLGQKQGECDAKAKAAAHDPDREFALTQKDQVEAALEATNTVFGGLHSAMPNEHRERLFGNLYHAVKAALEKYHAKRGMPS